MAGPEYLPGGRSGKTSAGYALVRPSFFGSRVAGSLWQASDDPGRVLAGRSVCPVGIDADGLLPRHSGSFSFRLDQGLDSVCRKARPDGRQDLFEPGRSGGACTESGYCTGGGQPSRAVWTVAATVRPGFLHPGLGSGEPFYRQRGTACPGILLVHPEPALNHFENTRDSSAHRDLPFSSDEKVR